MVTGRRSARARSNQRGATLFVVVLAMTLLTGVGLYTIHASSLAARAAGNGREALQAARVAEANAMSLISDLRIEPHPLLQEAVNESIKADPNYACEMNYGLANTTCKQVVPGESIPPTGAAIVPLDSLGPLNALSGSARMEITDVNVAGIPVPGHDQDDSKLKLKFYQATVTIISSLSPSGVGASCNAGMMQVTGQNLLRTHLLVGPTPEISPETQ